MTKRSVSNRSSRAGQLSLNRIITIVVMVGVGALLLYYLFTGSDPLGLFTEPEGTAVPTGVTAGGSGTAGGDWWHVYFTDPEHISDPENLSGSIPEKLIALINSAQRTIHVAAFEFDLTPVAEALIAAHRRGVEVRWVTDDESGIEADEEEGHGQFAMLEKAGIEVVDDGRGALMHDKFWIFDGRTVWTGSTNITVNGNFRNNNNVIVIESAALGTIYEREFGEMWAGEFGPTSTSTLDEQSVTVGGSAIQVLFAPEDEVAEHLIPLVEGARESLRIMAFSFTDDEMGAAVLARAKAGVEVRVIFERRGSETEYSEMPRLYCAGVPVRQDGNPGTFHHKVLVIDGETVVTGSYNFTQSADESNDENALVVTNPQIAAEYLQEFERRWAEGSEPDPADIRCD
jgi:phosphatidylserine/phosphatidylglycerophosphate/cardiolipin synthase-like enzyme